MDLVPEWTKLPEPGSFIYIEQVSPVRAFIGKVVLIWRNEDERDVISVIDGANTIVNLAEDDRWVPYGTQYAHRADIEILRKAGICPCCGAPLLESRSGNLDHAWLWS
jgi:hypothetical protein